MKVTWLQWILLSMFAGELTGLLWPFVVKMFKANAPTIALVGIPASASPFARTLRWLVLVVFVALVLTMLGLAAFVGSAEDQAKLRATGTLAYFSAYTYGFAGAAFIEEPLKRT